MKRALFYDSETSGLPDFKAPSAAEHQPHIVQLAATMVDLDTRKVISSMDVIIRPDGWTIPDEVTALHGITTEIALDVGVQEAVAIDMFLALWNASGRVRVAHNEQFDARIVRIGLKRFHDTPDAIILPSDDWKSGTAECTARLSTKICNLPPSEKMLAANRKNAKTPNLGEAYRHFFGCDFDNAHTALADVNACIAVYFAIQDHGNNLVIPA